MLEACHMLKVARSTIAEKGTIMYDEGEVKLQVTHSFYQLFNNERAHFSPNFEFGSNCRS